MRAQNLRARHDSPGDCGIFKWYIHNLEGGLGAGVRYPLLPCTDNPPEAIVENRWYQFVVTFDSGDYLDKTAGLSLYVNGQPYLPAHPGNGNVYSGLGSLDGDQTQPAWQITPRNGDAPFKLGTRSGASYFTGDIDEFAIFSRKLTCEEIASLVGRGPDGCQNRPPVAVLSASAPPVIRHGDPLTVDASASYDPDGNAISYSWAVTPPLGVALDIPGVPAPTFTPALVGDYSVSLELQDSFGAVSTPVAQTVTVLRPLEWAQYQIEIASSEADALTLDDIVAPGQRLALRNLIRQASDAIERRNAKHAAHKLIMAIVRTDGWSLRGRPDMRGPESDFVISKAPATHLYDALNAALAAVQSL